MAESLADGTAAPPEPVIIKDSQGNPYTVDASELDTYLRSGEGYSIAPSEEQATAAGQVPIQTPGGAPQFVSPEEAQQRIQSFEADAGRTSAAIQAEEEQRYGGALQGARAASAGWLRGLTFGVSDQALTRLDPTLAPDLEALQRYRGGLSTAGELAGMAAPLLASGGSSALASGARGAGVIARGAVGAGELAGEGATYLARTAGLAEGGLAARTIGSAARGAVEVGLMEAGREVSQAAIQQRELEASKVASAFGHGALIGGALMGGGTAAWGAAKGLGSAASSIGRWGAEKIAPGAAAAAEEQGAGFVRGMARQLEEELAAKSLGALKKEMREFTGEAFVRTGAKDRAVEMAQEMALKNTAEKAALAKSTLESAGRGVGEAIDALSASGVRADITDLAASIEQRAADFAARSGPQYRTAAKEAESWLADIKTAAGDGDVKRLWQFKKDLGDSTVWKPHLEAFGSPAEKLKRDLYRQVDDLIVQTGESTGDAAFSEVWKAANREYQAAQWVKRSLDDKLAQQSNRVLGLSEQIGGAAGLVAGGGFTPAGIALAAGSAALQRIVKSYGADAGTLALKALREGNTAALSGLVDRAVGDSVAGYLKAGSAKAIDAATGKMSGTLARTQASSYAQETEIGKALFGEPEAKRGTAAKPTARVALTPVLKAPARGEVSDRQVKRAAERIQASAQQQQAALERIAEMAPQLAPEIRGQLAASKRAHDYLLSRIPQSSNLTATLTPQAEGPRMSKSQRDEFLTAARVIADPLSVLDSLKSGTISKSEVDALKATSPELFAQIQADIQTQLDARTEPLPYRKALDLSLLLGVVGHPSLDPAVMRSVQSAYAPTQSPQPPQMASAPKRTISTASTWALRPEES